ncbi:MAG TPA: GNAT family N-acetyltransferase [Methylomirabilota bacterium]|jgi:GNAT superfamily N-acetyltransferase|nr:GNAT family N-acetyltransferase [Methylomirabilota bacterium]
MRIALRPASESDEGFLRELYRSTRERELAQIPWNDAQKQAFVEMQFQAQKRHYASAFPEASHDIICRDGEPAGRLYVDRRAEEIHILDMIVEPSQRRQGIASAVLEELLREADQAGKRATIYVDELNPCPGVFEPLGFRQKLRSGFQILLERPPASRA